MITDAKRRFPCRIKLGIPTGGSGAQLTEMQAWLDENCGANGWAITPAGLRGVINDAVAIHFLDATLAAAFVSRWIGPHGGLGRRHIRRSERADPC
jgi:hypothetical protein